MKRETDSKSSTKHSRPKVTSSAANSTAADSAQQVEIVHTKSVAAPPQRINREQLVIEAAYHHAEARGFEPGHELEDWLVAEAEVDARLCSEGCIY